MARSLRVEIDGDSSGGRKALDDVADESDKTAATLRGLAREMKDAARAGGHLEGELDDVAGSAKKTSGSVTGLATSTDHAAGQFREAARAAEKLDAAMAATRVEVARLQKAFVDGGDAKILTQIQQQYREYDRIEKIKKRIAEDGGDSELKVLTRIQQQYREYDRISKIKKRIAKDEEEFAKKAAERLKANAVAEKRGGRGILRNTLGDLAGLGVGAVKQVGGTVADATGKIPGSSVAKAAIGASLVPVAGASIGGAALAGGALAGVGLGVAGAIANNPEPFRKAWEAAITEISKRWQSASAGFEGPSLRAFSTIKKAVDGIDIEGILKAALPYVEPLAKGIGGFITPLGNGIKKLVEAAGPIVAVLERNLPLLGKAFEQAFGDIGEGAGGAADALDDIFQVIGVLIVAVGKFAKTASDVYAWGQSLGLLSEQQDRTVVSARALKGATDEQATSSYNAAEATKKLADAVAYQNEEFDKAFGVLLTSIEATSEFEAAQDSLTEGFKRGKDALDASTASGRDNIDLAVAYVKSAKDVRDAAIAAGDGSREASVKANAAYEAQIQKLEGILVKLGVSKAEAHNFATQFMGLDGMVADVYVKTHYVNDRAGQSRAGNDYASGGTFPYSGPKMVGEAGRELIWGQKSEYVSNAAETRRMVAAWSAVGNGGGRQDGGGGGGMTVTVNFAGDTDQAFASSFQRLVRTGQIQFAVG